jgi:cyclic-di-GMP-binding protein
MAKDSSFDVVSDFEMAEMTNAVEQAQRELGTRFDFKGTAASLDWSDGKNGLVIEGESRNQCQAVLDVLQSKLVRRGLSLKVLDTSREPAESGKVVRWQVPFKRGLDQDKSKQLTRVIRDKYPKVKAQIQGDTVRVSSTSKDDLQGVMVVLKAQDFEFPLEFQNLR